MGFSGGGYEHNAESETSWYPGDKKERKGCSTMGIASICQNQIGDTWFVVALAILPCHKKMHICLS